MKNTTIDTYTEYELLWSCYSEDDLYPEEDIPYSCSEEAEAAELELSLAEAADAKSLTQ
ncbi:hypothetical protein [uncultured Pseudoteredinibacter sp.]|uniref:hypothetical protein n=1 Tax=uncultured Pseudoteredinibacter sp. TaxID=1641701 RepID=UPI0026149182|nr:hypothetical protein [uncultured Pseudoteredinibacter sp.]